LIAFFVVLVLFVLGGLVWTGSRSEEFALAEYSVQNLSCGSCVQNIRNALGGVKGVGEVEVSVTSGRARVEYAPSGADAETIARRITEAGYPAELVRDLSAADYQTLREDASRLADRFVGRVGNRLISREAFAEALSRREGEVETPKGGLLKTTWNQILQREILLSAAEENAVVVQEGEVDLRLQEMRQKNDDFETAVHSRFGGEAGFRRWLKEEMIIQRTIEEHVLRDESDPNLRRFKLDQWFKNLAATVPVAIFDPALKAAVEEGGKGCGGSCCG